MSCCNQCSTTPCCCPPNQGVPFQIAGPMGPQGLAGPQGNPGSTGPQGLTGPQGFTGITPTSESGLFSINTTGSAGTVNGAPIVPTVITPGSVFDITIPTVRTLVQATILAAGQDITIQKSSIGTDNGTNAMIIGFINTPPVVNYAIFTSTSIYILDIGLTNGWTARINSISATSFTLRFTIHGIPTTNTLGQWIGIMGN